VPYQEKVAGFPSAATAVVATTSGSSAESAFEGSPTPSAGPGAAAVSPRNESSQAFPSLRGQPTRPRRGSDGAEQNVVGASRRGRRQRSARCGGGGGDGSGEKPQRRASWGWWCRDAAWLKGGREQEAAAAMAVAATATARGNGRWGSWRWEEIKWGAVARGSD